MLEHFLPKNIATALWKILATWLPICVQHTLLSFRVTRLDTLPRLGQLGELSATLL
jgi:hypothetical protein